MDSLSLFTTWHQGDSQDGTGIAKAAFESVKKHLEQSKSLTDKDKALLQSSSSREDVQRVVASEMAKYEARAESSKTRKWLERFSEAICHYSKVLDVFVQHHPEYVALVWGTMKLLFVRITDCTNNIGELADVGSHTEIRVMHASHTSKLDEIIQALEESEGDRKRHMDSLSYAVSRLEVSSKEHDKKLDIIIHLLGASGITINDFIARVESENCLVPFHRFIY
ncbi:hypothetical protein LCI18_000522 [Fusarium solani-melongenae]|uniref:Uncharacterized protein n=1 Tax=Fusarium solani subsp. cucurbitae TaxID=2747967 RepID=A0ACD3YKY4_FUSSC|nr:hypothetical protein LCI18_000522 [Fusarium solani-melongenae]